MRETQQHNIYVTQSSMPPFEEYIETIRPLWDTHCLTNMGKLHTELESRLKLHLGVDYISLMSNGHNALELAIQSMNFPRGAEVITTPYTFVSTTHAIVRNDLIPVFCDIKLDDYTIDEDRIESLITDKTVAIVPVHVYGNVCNTEKIEYIARKYNLKVIYDAAHAFGEVYKGHGIGTYGDMSIFSFHATKVYNTIEGGAVCCHTKEQYDALYNLKNFGIRSEELVASVGTNAKMNEFQAAMGLCNLNHIEEEILKRRQVAEWYDECFREADRILATEQMTMSSSSTNHKVKNQDGNLNTYDNDVNSRLIKLNTHNRADKRNYAYYPVVFKDKETRDAVYDELKHNGIYARKYFYPLTCDMECYKEHVACYAHTDVSNARYVSDRILTLPMYADLEKEDVERIVRIIRSVYV